MTDIPKKWVFVSIIGIVIFVAGVVSIINGAASWLHGVAVAQKKQAKLTVVHDATKAGFAFLVPPASGDWQFDPKSPVFDATEGVVDYQVTFSNGNKVTISEQPMPQSLKPANTSAKFNQFIITSNVASSVQMSEGDVYFRQATTNGAPASGAVTVIYATKDILMFGSASNPLDNQSWVKLFSAMAPVSAN